VHAGAFDVVDVPVHLAVRRAVEFGGVHVRDRASRARSRMERPSPRGRRASRARG
jgi:hypothetical protein